MASHMLVFSQATGTLKGRVLDKETKEPVPFANIVIEMNGVQAGGATSDFDGNYIIKPINPGKYDVKATFVGFKPLMVRGLVVGSGKIEFLDVLLESTSVNLEAFEIVDYKVPVFRKDETSSGATVTSDQIDKMPGRSATAVATTVGGVFSSDGERGSVRGARSDATATYIDGIKVSSGSSSLPPSAIEQVSVIISGVPAQYGDATSGVINVITKGPSNQYNGGVELQTSEGLDKFGYSRAGFNLMGPIIRKKNVEAGTSRSVMGFFLAADLLYQKDNNPSNIGRWKVTDEKLEFLKENPVRPTGMGFGIYENYNFLYKNDLEHVNNSMNAKSMSANLTGKLDFKLTTTLNFTLGGSFNYGKNKSFNYSRSMMNWDNNAEVENLTYRTYARLTQRFEADKNTDAFIKNIYYSLQADFSNFDQKVTNPNFGDELFKIGYIGKFTTSTVRSYELGSVSVNGQNYNNIWLHNGYRDTLYAFEAADFNREIARYTEMYYDFYNSAAGNYENRDQVLLGGGLVNGDSPGNVYGMWQAPGTQYNGYSKYNAQQLGLNAMMSADIGNHEVQFGLQYEKRTERSYNVNPQGFWWLMDGLTNYHIKELDVNDPQLVLNNGIFQDTIYFNRKYDAGSQQTFDINLRRRLNLPTNGTDFINVDSYDFASRTINYYDKEGNMKTISLGEDLFDISLFSADELLNDGNSYVGYYGYDYKGNKLNSKPTIDDFLNDKDENGIFTRNLPAFEPIYMGGYIQDKFSFKDLIFNVGVRVDRFDANQLTLKDPFSPLYSARTVQEVDVFNGASYQHPGNMGSDYVVYVDNVTNPGNIMGYRNGSTWFNAEGVEIADPSVLDAGTGVSPYIYDPANKTLSKDALKDYDPQVAIMPRISFSFPISEEALFYAHYDILTQRPTSNSRFDVTDYYYFDTRTGIIENPSLKPTKTIDYELGFKQRLTVSSALSLSAYYKEMRDDIQVFRFSGAYPRDYVSYNNIDFGTTKGFTVAYDLRRTGNLSMRASYTLQFADGTGSSTTTAAALIAAGLPNLRTTNPLAWDRRHSVNLSVDFRFDEGKLYDGPRINRKEKGPIDLLKNTGINFTVTGGSGTPYTRSSNIVSALTGGTQLLKGSYYGSRIPWQFKVDARLDRDITITWKKDGDKKKTSILNVYVEVLNLFNFENIMGVYPATGNPDDDGYLAAAEWQRQINEQLDPQSFRDLYSIFVNNPGNYSRPRYIRAGLTFNF